MYKFSLKSELKEIDGVYQFKINFPSFEGLQFVCMYLLNIDNSYVLIDAGLNFSDCEKLFFSGLKKLKISSSNLKYLIITHEHPDHIGLLNILKKRIPHVQIAMHEITHNMIKWMTNSKKMDEIQSYAKEGSLRMMKFGVSENQSKRVYQFMRSFRNFTLYNEPDRILKDNDEILINSKKLKVIWTPGHSIGHICIFDETKKYLFSGDHILSRITPHIGAFLPNPILEKDNTFTNILDMYLKSLDRIDQLNPKIIFPAHQEIIYNPHERILAIKKHHENRLAEIANTIQNTPKTPFKISQLHFGENLSEINTFLALSEVLSHLIYLEHQNKIKRIEKNNKIFFIKT